MKIVVAGPRYKKNAVNVTYLVVVLGPQDFHNEPFVPQLVFGPPRLVRTVYRDGGGCNLHRRHGCGLMENT